MSRPLVEIVRAAWLREQQQEIENQRTGKIGGGVWGCLSGDFGVRFESRDQRVDFLLHCDLWLDSVGPTTPRERILFTKAEGREFRRAFISAWR